MIRTTIVMMAVMMIMTVAMITITVTVKQTTVMDVVTMNMKKDTD